MGGLCTAPRQVQAKLTAVNKGHLDSGGTFEHALHVQIAEKDSAYEFRPRAVREWQENTIMLPRRIKFFTCQMSFLKSCSEDEPLKHIRYLC